MTRWCCNKAAPRACVGVGNCVCYVELAKQLRANSEPGGKEESEWNKQEGQQCKFSKHGNL